MVEKLPVRVSLRTHDRCLFRLLTNKIQAVENPILFDDLGNALTFARQLTILYHENSPLDRRRVPLDDHAIADFAAAYR